VGAAVRARIGIGRGGRHEKSLLVTVLVCISVLVAGGNSYKEGSSGVFPYSIINNVDMSNSSVKIIYVDTSNSFVEGN
jgi:hypothetical protein